MLKLTKQEVVQKTRLVLKKRGVDVPPVCAVKAVLDTSGSFKPDWDKGTVALLTMRVLAVANQFDDNGELEMYHFNDDIHQLETMSFADVSDPQDWIRHNVLQSHQYLWHGTQYAPIVNEMMQDVVSVNSPKQRKADAGGGLFGKLRSLCAGLVGQGEDPVTVAEFNPAAPLLTAPTAVYIVTDGENYDQREVIRLLDHCESWPIYFMFVNANNMAENAKTLADRYSNVGYAFIPNLDTASDDEILEALISEEFLEWRSRYPASI